MSAAERDAIALLAGFAGIAAVGVALPMGDLGWRILALAVGFTVALVALSRARRPEWRPMAALLVPLSAFQVFPDYFLADVLGILIFDETGGPRVGPVPLFMACLWTIPLFAVLSLALAAEARGWRAGRVAAAGSLALFGASEATCWAIPIWHAERVLEVAHVALYVLPAEAALGAGAWAAFRAARAGEARGVTAAAAVACGYAGALVFGFLLVERVLR